MANWFESGYQGVDRELDKRDLGGLPKRWWMAAGTTKQAVFIDDSPITFDEHQWKVEGSKFPQFGTCLAKVSSEPCPACGAKGVSKADYVGHLTVVDVTGYKTKEGKEVKFELVEFCPKLKALNKLKMKKQAKTSLIGQLYQISRSDENAPNTGDDFDHLREANMENLYKVVTYRGKNLSEMIAIANGTGDQAAKARKYLAHHFQIPNDGPIPEEIPVFNYMKLHEPMDPPDFRRAIAGAVGFGSSGSSTTGDRSAPASSDDVPF